MDKPLWQRLQEFAECYAHGGKYVQLRDALVTEFFTAKNCDEPPEPPTEESE